MKRSKNINIRVTPTELAILNRAAKERGVTKTSFVVNAVKREAQRGGQQQQQSEAK